MSTNIEGKVVVLTGGSAGLGEDAARYLAARRAAVVRAMPGRDQELLRSLRDGSASAFETLQNLYSHRLFKQIVAITRNHEDAEDSLQETFLQVFRRLHTFEGRSHIATWLTRIAINTALMKVRKRRSLAEIPLERTSDADEEPVVYDLPDSTLGPEQIYEQQEQLKRLKDAVKHLGPTLRVAVNVWLTTDCSIDQTAQSLGLSVSAVKTRVSRARRQLRDSLQPDNVTIRSTIPDRRKKHEITLGWSGVGGCCGR